MLLGNRGKIKRRLGGGRSTLLVENGEKASALAARNAGSYFDQGFNCAQSVYLAASDIAGTKSSPELISGLAALTGGIGNSGCTCGALTGASIFISNYTVDPSKPTISKLARKQSGLFHDIFKSEFRSTCCRALRKDKDFKDKKADQECKNLTCRTTELLVEMLMETG